MFKNIKNDAGIKVRSGNVVYTFILKWLNFEYLSD